VLEVTTPPLTELDAEGARRASVAYEGMFPWDPKADVTFSDIEIPGGAGTIPARVFVPRARPASPMPVLIYFHGGGFVLGSHVDTDICSLCGYLAEQAGCAVVSVGYRLAPESRFPAAVEDAYSSLLWVAGNPSALGIDPERIAVGGDSAGGNIAAVLSLMSRDREGPAIRFQLLIYPVTDHSFETESYRTCGSGYGLATEEMRWFWAHYLRAPFEGANAYASPLRARSLAGLPPALVITAEFDPLRDEGEAYGKRLRDAGVAAEVVRYDGTIHAFVTLPFGGAGRRHAAAALRTALHPELPPTAGPG
jgi:acetyl esterase